MSGHHLEPYQYDEIPTETSLRVLELLPGTESDPISCSLRTVDWPDGPAYEAVSYVWGDPNAKAPVNCDGKRLEVTVNLHAALTHFRYQDRSRFLWADALWSNVSSTNQSNIPERGSQVSQMRKIYEHAKAVLIWLGQETQEDHAKTAIDSILQLSDFIRRKTGITIPDLESINDVYQEVVFKNRDKLPLPHECGFATDAMWDSLRWLYSRPYFTRVWVIQEINANKDRLLHCGWEKIEWDRVHLVAGYMILETAWSKAFGFSSTYCWWVATMSTELISHRKKWLHMLYLASNFSCTDSRVVIFGLRGLMIISDGAELLRPDYSKSTMGMYRNSVEAAFLNFQTTDALLYTTGKSSPSWVPQWNQSMLFRNPFRFGKAMPWKPAGDSKPTWKIDKDSNALFLTAIRVDSIKSVEHYNESFFGKAMMESDEGKKVLQRVWKAMLETMAKSQSDVISKSMLTAAATSLSFGLDEHTNPGDERYLLHNFLAYLRAVVDEETYKKLIPPDLSEESKGGNAEAFGKPVWDFEYPESTFYVTERNVIGCSTSVNSPGDVVCIPLGSTYVFVLRPVGSHFLLKGFSYVHGIMYGELSSETQVFEIH